MLVKEVVRMVVEVVKDDGGGRSSVNRGTGWQWQRWLYANIQIGTEGWHCLSSWKSRRTKSRGYSVWSRARRARMHVCWVLYILSIWWYSVTFGVFAHFQIYRTAVTISAMPHSRQAPQNENESDRKCFYQAFPIRISKICVSSIAMYHITTRLGWV